MTFFEFLKVVGESGIGGRFLVFIICTIPFIFFGYVVQIPFEISNIKNDVEEIKNLLKKEMNKIK